MSPGIMDVFPDTTTSPLERWIERWACQVKAPEKGVVAGIRKPIHSIPEANSSRNKVTPSNQ